MKVNLAKVQEALRSLEKTIVTLPEDLRIAEVNIEQDQVVNMQQEMVVAHGIDVMEVDAQLSIHDMQTLASSLSAFTRDENGLPKPDMSQVSARIYLQSGSLKADWPAEVARISETVDEAQATAGVILEIEQSYKALSPQTAPPLVNGMFVSAEVEGQANPSWVVPERAVHGDKIYLLNEESRLSIVPITVLYRRDNLVVIDGDLEQGQKLILNDLLPAIDGMLLREEGSSEEVTDGTQEASL